MLVSPRLSGSMATGTARHRDRRSGSPHPTSSPAYVSTGRRPTVPAAAAGIRTAMVRTGLVLAADEGGALAKMLLPFKLGFGGRLGSGARGGAGSPFDDHIRAIRHIIDKPVSGPVNLTSPNPVTNARFIKALGKVLHRPTLVPVPKFALDCCSAASLPGRCCSHRPGCFLRTGEHRIRFSAPEMETALRAVLG